MESPDGGCHQSNSRRIGEGLRWSEEDVLREVVDPGAWARGPHSRSNWLPIGQRERLQFCVGGWPFKLPSGYGISGESDEEAETKVRLLLEAGVTTFVNLTQSTTHELLLSTASNSSYASWEPRVRLLGTRIGASTLNFSIKCPMPDEGVTSDDLLAKLLEELLEELCDQERVLYVHCYGGHGRSGVVGCSILCLLYPCLAKLPQSQRDEWCVEPMRSYVWPRDAVDRMRLKFGAEVAQLTESAVAAFNRCHSERVFELGGGCLRFPHSLDQLEQVARVASGEGPFARLHGLLDGSL